MKNVVVASEPPPLSLLRVILVFFILLLSDFTCVVDFPPPLFLTQVHFLRLPHSSYSSALTEAHTILNATVAKAAAEVHARRAAASTIYTEKDWWLLAPQVHN